MTSREERELGTESLVDKWPNFRTIFRVKPFGRKGKPESLYVLCTANGQAKKARQECTRVFGVTEMIDLREKAVTIVHGCVQKWEQAYV